MYNTTTLVKEFKQELGLANSTSNLQQRVLKIINNLGWSDYSLIRLDTATNFKGQHILAPKTLLCSYHNEQANRSGTLSQAKTASTRNRHLSMLYHFAACAPTDSVMLSKRRLQLILITSVGHHNYCIIPNGTQLTDGFTTSLINNTLQHQTINKSNTAHALHALVNTLFYIGSREFPEIFFRKPTYINPQPQRVLNILALEDATINQAAKQLDVTINTINKHIATAKKAFGTNTIAGTVWRAINEGLINE